MSITFCFEKKRIQPKYSIQFLFSAIQDTYFAQNFKACSAYVEKKSIIGTLSKHNAVSALSRENF